MYLVILYFLNYCSKRLTRKFWDLKNWAISTIFEEDRGQYFEDQKAQAATNYKNGCWP
jgi:hypothetical protein